MRPSDLNFVNIGSRLALTFAVLVVLTVGGNAVLLWQFHIARVQTERLAAVSRQMISVLRLQEGVLKFHERLDELAQTQDAKRLIAEAVPMHNSLLEQTRKARDAVARFPPEIRVDPAFVPTLEAIEITLPTQIDAIKSLAESGDWEAVHMRLASELKPLETHTSALIDSIDQEVSEEMGQAESNMKSVQRRIVLIVPTTAITTLFIAAFLAWAIARRFILLRLEERIEERTRIARELHDTLLQGVISASMQLHVVVDSLPLDSPARPKFSRILQLTAQVIDEGRNAVRGFRATNHETRELEGALSKVPQELDFQGNTVFRVIVDGHPQPLHPVIRDEVYAISREALVNAFRHSSARNIRVSLEYSASQLRVVVNDDGRGMDEGVLSTGRDGHWGLSGMRERTQRIGGKLKILSRDGAGTEVELRLPAEIAFESHSSSAFQSFIRLYRRLKPTTSMQHAK